MIHRCFPKQVLESRPVVKACLPWKSTDEIGKGLWNVMGHSVETVNCDSTVQWLGLSELRMLASGRPADLLDCEMDYPLDFAALI